MVTNKAIHAKKIEDSYIAENAGKTNPIVEGFCIPCV